MSRKVQPRTVGQVHGIRGTFFLLSFIAHSSLPLSLSDVLARLFSTILRDRLQLIIIMEKIVLNLTATRIIKTLFATTTELKNLTI